MVRQRVLHSSSVKIERKYLNAAKFSFFKGIIFSVVITNICITSPGHWDNCDCFLIVITDFWLLGSRAVSLSVSNPPQLDKCYCSTDSQCNL